MVDANLIIIAVYVDDLLMIGSDEKLIKEFIVEMLKAFEMIDLGLMNLRVELYALLMSCFLVAQRVEMVKGKP